MPKLEREPHQALNPNRQSPESLQAHPGSDVLSTPTRATDALPYRSAHPTSRPPSLSDASTHRGIGRVDTPFRVDTLLWHRKSNQLSCPGVVRAAPEGGPDRRSGPAGNDPTRRARLWGEASTPSACDPMPRTDERITPPPRSHPSPGPRFSEAGRVRRTHRGCPADPPLARTRLPRPRASAPQALDTPASRSAANRRPERHRPLGACTRSPAGAPESGRGPGRRPGQAPSWWRPGLPERGRVTPCVLGPPGPPIPLPSTV
jgi:hypothetical protein